MTIQGRGGEETKESPVKYLIIRLCLLHCHSTTDPTAPPPSAKVRVCVFALVCDSGGETQSELVVLFTDLHPQKQNPALFLLSGL